MYIFIYMKKINYSVLTGIFISVALLAALTLTKRSKEDFSLIVKAGDILNLALAFLYIIEIKTRFNKIEYLNHSFYLFFPIKRIALVKKELIRFISRPDVLCIILLFSFLCYHLYFFSYSLDIFIYFIVLYLAQIIFLLLVITLIKNYPKKMKDSPAYVYNFYIFLLLQSSFLNPSIGLKLPFIQYIFPFPGFFYLPITTVVKFSIFIYLIIIILFISLIFLMKHRLKEWQL